MQMKRSVMDVVVVVTLLVAFGASPAVGGQTPGTGRLMREKLAHSQRILDAILTSNFSLLERESAALVKTTNSPAWTQLKGPEYAKQSRAFLIALDQLSEAARTHDLDAAAERYTALTATCFACHRELKGKRIAGGETRPSR